MMMRQFLLSKIELRSPVSTIKVLAGLELETNAFLFHVGILDITSKVHFTIIGFRETIS